MNYKMEKEFIKANANKSFINAQFTDVLRDLIRAIAAENDYQSGV